MKRIIVVAIASLMMLALNAQEKQEPYKLTTNSVEKFIKKFPLLQKDLERLGMKWDQGENDFVYPPTAMKQLDGVCQKHGYDNLNDFSLQAYSIIMAYAALATEGEQQNTNSYLQESINQIKNNPDLSEEQKKQALAQIEAAMAAFNNYASSVTTSANVAVVKQYQGQIETLMEEFE